MPVKPVFIGSTGMSYPAKYHYAYRREDVAKLMSLIDDRATREKSKKLLAVQGKIYLIVLIY